MKQILSTKKAEFTINMIKYRTDEGVAPDMTYDKNAESTAIIKTID